jgi:AraC-type DNA-binding domain-containing proteins
MKDLETYYNQEMPNPYLGIDIFLADNFKNGRTFRNHWHEQMQLYYFTEGRAIIECSGKSFNVAANDIIVINSNELHGLSSISDDLEFYTIRIDASFLFSNQIDLCQTKYLAPLTQNQIIFKNLVKGDNRILNCVNEAVQEYSLKETGYELALKSSIYRLIVLLLREYVHGLLTDKELLIKENNLKRFDLIFQYINNNYSNKIRTEDLAELVHISTFHFCRVFKQLTGMTATDYINKIRMEKAIGYLNGGELNITEIALRCGFDSINYFSRLFKIYYNVSPTKYISK